MAKTRAGRIEDSDDSVAITTGKTYFLGIGIDQYQAWPRLRNAVRDVQVIREVLVQDYGLQSENAYTLYDKEATRAAVIHALEDMADRVTNTDSLLVYYAGHGHLNDRQRGYWVPADAPKDGISYYISNSTIRDYLGDINSLHTLLISDACFSGSLFVRGERSGDLAAHELAKLSSRWAICSGRHDEVVADGPKDGHSPFADSILDVLRKTERSIITTNFLFEQVREQTRANYDQLPDGGPIQGVGHKRGQYIFKRSKKESGVWAEAQQNNTAEAYRYYLGLFPAGEHAAAASAKLHEISGQQAWQLLTELPTDSLGTIETALQQVRHFCQEFTTNEHYSEALQLGQQLEHKRSYLQAYDSEFALMELLRKGTPFKNEVETRLAQLQGAATPEPDRADPAPARETPPKVVVTVETPRKTQAQTTRPNSSQDKNLNSKLIWIIGGLVFVLAIFWGISKLGGNSGGTDLKKKEALIKENLYKAMRDRDIAKIQQLEKEYRALPDDIRQERPLKLMEQWVIRYRDSLSRAQTPPPKETQSGSSKTRYMVHSDFFKTKEEAAEVLNEMQQLELNQLEIIELRPNRFVVKVGVRDDLIDAENFVSQLEIKGFATYVKEQK